LTVGSRLQRDRNGVTQWDALARTRTRRSILQLVESGITVALCCFEYQEAGGLFMAQIFLSYARSDIEHAKRLYTALSRNPSARVWFDKVDLIPGMKWKPAIRKAIRDSRYFIALLSKRSAAGRGFRHSELKQALEIVAEFPDDQIYLIPTRIEPCKPPVEQLSDYNFADLFPDWDLGIAQLCTAVRIQRTAGSKRRASPKRQAASNTIVKVALRGKVPPKRSALEYHYRIGVVELDAPTSELKLAIHGLNAIQNYFLFSRSSAAVNPRALRAQGGFPQLDLEGLTRSFYASVAPIELDYVICVTRRFLAFEQDGYPYWNYLGVQSTVDERIKFVSIGGLEEHAAAAGVSYESALAYGLASDLTSYFLDLSYHKALRECPLDFTEDHSLMTHGMRAAKFCGACEKALSKNKKLRRAVTAMLRWGRK
jgi:hypothetical protein